MPKINFNVRLLDENGEHIKDESPWKTLKSAAVVVCTIRQLQGDESMAPERAAKLGFLALKLNFKDTLDLESEEVSLLKERIGKAAPPVVVIRCHRLLEGKHQVPSAKELGIEDEGLAALAESANP